MQFIIKPDDTSLSTFLETASYQRIWKEHARCLRASFRRMTGMEFQQRTITARVYKGDRAEAGSYHKPMTLPTDYGTVESKLTTIVHELSHRLLNGNDLNLSGLGIIEAAGEYTDDIIEVQHRLIYLFEYDVMHDALGESGGRSCQYNETRIGHEAYRRAWRWAMGLSFEQRQKGLAWVTSHKLIRSEWGSLDDKPVPPRSLATWLRRLDVATRS